MTLIHETIQLTRTLGASVEDVFAAWQSTEALQQWCCPGDNGWSGAVEEHAFEVGGTKRIVFGPEGEEPYIEDSRYLDIVPGTHIINSERISKSHTLISASIISLEFSEQRDGCQLVVTDKLTLLNEQDSPEDRRGGWGEVLEKLEGYLK